MVVFSLKLWGSPAGLVSAGGDGGNVGNGADGAGTEFQGGFADHVIGSGVLGQGDDHAAGMSDSGLLAGNFGDGIAEKFLVVERNVDYDRNHGLNNIGCIQTAAHADFEHRDIHLSLGELLEGDGGQHLKKTGMPGQLAGRDQTVGSLFDAIMQSGERGVTNFFAVNANALVQADQVGLSVERGAVPGGPQNGSQGSGGRALAIGAGDE